VGAVDQNGLKWPLLLGLHEIAGHTDQPFVGPLQSQQIALTLAAVDWAAFDLVCVVRLARR